MDIEKHQKLLGQRELGARAYLIATGIEPHLQALEQDTLAGLKSDFRSGTLDLTKLLVKVGQLCNLEDIRSRLTADVRRGEHAGREIG